MRTYLVRSVALSTKTADAWKEAGAVFIKRGRSTEYILNGYDADVILNLGKSTFRTDDRRVWNMGSHIDWLLYPGRTRAYLGPVMPPRPETYPAEVWVKAPGAHGRGKYLERIDEPLQLPPTWDWQLHVEGQEWRLVTVNNKVVTCMKRHGENGDRTYEWVRMRDTPSGLKALARQCAEGVSGNSVVAWDFIDTPDNGPYLFEGNTCPGVNVHTAKRILTQIEKEIDYA